MMILPLRLLLIIGILVIVVYTVEYIDRSIKTKTGQYREAKNECSGMDITATCQYMSGKITKKQAEKESKERGWKQ